MTHLAVGDRITTREELEALPIGTRIATVESPSEWWEKHEGGYCWWQYDDSDESYRNQHIDLEGYNYVVSIPGVTTTESLSQFQWRYRMCVWSGAESASVEYDTVTRALNEMGAGDERFPFGVGLKINSSYELGRLPEGSMIHCGNVETWDHYGLYVKERSRWRHLLGGITSHGRVCTVDAVAGEEVHQPWITDPGDANSAEQIAMFKAKAYRVGFALKSSRGWCGEYDRVVNAVGINSSCIRALRHGGVTVGDRITPLQAVHLPIGTILRWRHRTYPETRVIWYMRVSNSSNEAGTKQLFGYRDDLPVRGHYASVMEVMAFPEDDGSLRLGDFDLDLQRAFRHLPTGTRFEFDGTTFAMCADHSATNWSPRRNLETGLHQLSAFGTNPSITITHFEEPA